jgi:hypothetical protein
VLGTRWKSGLASTPGNHVCGTLCGMKKCRYVASRSVYKACSGTNTKSYFEAVTGNFDSWRPQWRTYKP